MNIFLKILVVLALASCNLFESEKPPREEAALLTAEYAKKRSENISDVTYQLKFDLTEKESFQGTTAVHFTLKNLFYLTLDFAGGEVQELIVNGEKVPSLRYNGFFIEIPESFLKIGQNSILVSYTHDYSKNGVGLYRYNDIKDGKSYLYSMFEPYNANRMFPSFDQPDLKATYESQVLVPKDWQVISSTRENEVVDQGEYRLWYFPVSAKFSTYTYSLHAGDYVVWEDLAKTKNQEIPLRLFARQSLAPHVKVEDWFNWTKQGFDFFEKYFSYPYPYKKYDQLIVPDFNHGAMENVAAVTFNEDRYVVKGEKTREQRRALANTLFHEMAHMWFGNLVTMAWWDDLWLNESFATFSASEGISKATEFTEAWKVFNSRKQRSYQQDQSTTTHPIAMDCPHTQAAFANFDAITYGKGASVMKQLSFYLGEKVYGAALKNYFSEFAEKNTRLSDFMGTMEKASGKDLKGWEERWLKTAMLNQAEVFFTCQKGRIDHFEIYQVGTKDYPTLRTHKTLVALFKKSNGQFKLNRKVAVEYSGGYTKLPQFEGLLCPDIVHPNFEDHDYVVVNFDKISLVNIEGSLATLQDPFLRSIVWSDLWGMVLNQKMSLEKYLEIVQYNGLQETDIDTLSKIFDSVDTILKKYFPDSGQPWVAQREVWVKFFEESIMTKIYEHIQQPEIQRMWFDYLVQIAESEKALALLEKVVKQHKSGLPLNFPVGQDQRWAIISVLMSHDFPGAPELVELEGKRDKSKRAQTWTLYAQSLRPNLESKEKMFSSILAGKETNSFGNLRSIMSGLFPAQQKSLHRKFVDTYFENLKKLSIPGEEQFASTFAAAMAPTFCDQKSSAQIENFLQAEKNLTIPVVKTLEGALFENQQCQKIRRVFMNKEVEPLTDQG